MALCQSCGSRTGNVAMQYADDCARCRMNSVHSQLVRAHQIVRETQDLLASQRVLLDALRADARDAGRRLREEIAAGNVHEATKGAVHA